MLENFPRTNLGFWPTPLQACPQLTKKLDGPQIFIKRDDQSGLGLGGNKVRKLEFLLGDALQRGCDTLITGGAAQSNHCRQTAAAAAKTGLNCHLMLGGEAPPRLEGNLLLDELFGAHIHWCGAHRKGEDIPILANELEKSGSKTCIIPYGGSSATGALGFVAAMFEVQEQLLQERISIDHIIFASSSGGTHAGLVTGARLLDLHVQIHGIAIDKRPTGEFPFRDSIAGLCSDLTRALNKHQHIRAGELVLDEKFLGDGYGVVGDLERDAIRLLAQTEGILLDPVYSGRAFGAMTSLISQKQFAKNDKLLFWHTAGTPALFPYSGSLMPAGPANV